MALATRDRSVHRHTRPRAQAQHIPDDDIADVGLHKALATLHFNTRRRKLDKLGNRLARPSLGARFQIAAQQDQRNNDSRRFKINRARIARQPARCKSGNGRVGIGGHCPYRDERVHIRRTLEQERQANRIELPPWPNQHSACQHKLEYPRGLHPNSGHNPMVKWRVKMPAHFKEKDRQSQNQRDDEAPLQPADLLAPSLGSTRPCAFLLCRIARTSNSCNDVCLRNNPLQIPHAEFPRRKAHIGLVYAVQSAHRRLNTPHTRCTAHTLNDKHSILDTCRVARLGQSLRDLIQTSCAQFQARALGR